MKTRIKYTVLAMAACTLSTNAMAIELKSDGKDYGKVDAQFIIHHVLGAEGNGSDPQFDPEEGTAYGVKLKYLTPSWKNANLGIGFYNNGDLLNMTDFGGDKKIAGGMFVDPKGKETSLMGEFYATYAGEKFAVHGGRQLYKTPLTTIAYSTMPSFHTVFGISTTAIPDFNLSLDQVTQMSLGARTATDWGLIGENTGTAGVAINPRADGVGQAEFHDISLIATGDDGEDTNGITVLGGTYTGFKNAKISVWNYYADDISNTFYADGEMGMPLQGLKLKLAAQYLNQQAKGDLIEDYHPDAFDDVDYNLFGIKAALKGEKWMAYAAYNKSGGDTAMFNSWGGDPAYTSSIFSRNAYRENVSAYKVGVKYNFMKNLFAMVSYADYGQSDTNMGNGSVEAQTDAKETDIVVVYKPVKNLMLKLFHANRTSEYDGFESSNPNAVTDRTQAHTRLVASYSF